MFNCKSLIVSLFFCVSLFASTADELITQNGCLACHALASKKNAPAFAGIGRKNQRFYGSNAKAVIAKSIKNGSSGKYPRFSDTSMPAFGNLSNEDLGILADYILSQSSKARGNRQNQNFRR